MNECGALWWNKKPNTLSVKFPLYYLFTREETLQLQPFRKLKTCLLIHHPNRCPVTVIEEEIVIGATSRHKVTHGLPPLEISSFYNLQR